MGKECAVCSNKLGLVRYTSSDKYKICWKCIRKAGYGMNASFLTIRKIPLEEIKTRCETSNFALQNFDSQTIYTQFDDLLQKATFNAAFNQEIVVDYNDIIDYSIYEDEDTLTKSGLGKAIAGGIIAGPAGAVVGAIIGKGQPGKPVVSRLGIILELADGRTITVPFIKK